ncbi:hypothetical protein AB0D14_20785 [Streptomyces sp. NPDC048484]|uniref:hypothetical protein n=1 Tax=Streptomyces sp. NPDC048484 TaxID=3155146 RepID=UPI0034237993
MAARRSMITFATDPETKERIRSYAEAAGVDVSTYIVAAVGAAMAHDDQVARTFAPPDDLIAATEAESSTVAAVNAALLEDAIKCRKSASFLGWLAEGGLPDLTGPVDHPPSQQGGARWTGT